MPVPSEPLAPPDRPDVDQRLVSPEERYEIVDGEVVHVPPAEEPHGSRHSKIQAILEAAAATTFRVACDMLTRAGPKSDVAPDASVYPAERDPETGGRLLEHLAFEILPTQTRSHAVRKAALLHERGVRRVFAIDVERERAFEWNADVADWSILPEDASITDPALAVPIRVIDLVAAATVDDVLARTLLAKRNPVLQAAMSRRAAARFRAGLRRGRLEGRLDGLRKALRQALAVRGVTAGPSAQERIAAAAPEELEAWLASVLAGEVPPALR